MGRPSPSRLPWRRWLAQLKGTGAKHVAVGYAGGATLSAEHAEAAVAAAGDATYVYRHTKPSAPAAPPLSRLTLLCAKADAKAVQQGLAQGEAIAAGVALARECANRPGNHCTPTYLAEQAAQARQGHKASRSRCSTARRWKSSAWALSSPWRRGRPSRCVSSWPATTVRRRCRRRWCWSARASPSTPAASRSSRRPRWTR